MPARPWPRAAVPLLCLAVGVASLPWAHALGFDPAIWAVWGRDLVAGELDTGVVIAWKPLPVLVTAPAELLGIPATDAWLAVARGGAVLSLVAAFRVARRLAGWPAGLVAVAALLLSTALDARFLRLALQGSIEPLVAGLVLTAVDAHLDGRHGTAYGLGVLAALARPELAALVLLYGAWRWWHSPPARAWVVVGLVAIPLLWLGGDWMGSGDPFTGAARAQVVDGDGERVEQAWTAALRTVAAPVWGAALAAVVLAWRRRTWAPLVLAAGAVGVVLTIGAMTLVLGYASIGRFLLPASAVLCVVAGAGAVWLVRLGRSRWQRVLVAVVLAAVTAPFAVGLARMSEGGVDFTVRRASLDDALDDVLAAAGGRDALDDCGPVALEGGGVAEGSLWPSLAYRLDLPLTRVRRRLPGRSGITIVPVGFDAERIRTSPTGAQVLARNDTWVVVALRCPGTPAASSPGSDPDAEQG